MRVGRTGLLISIFSALIISQASGIEHVSNLNFNISGGVEQYPLKGFEIEKEDSVIVNGLGFAKYRVRCTDVDKKNAVFEISRNLNFGNLEENKIKFSIKFDLSPVNFEEGNSKEVNFLYEILSNGKVLDFLCSDILSSFMKSKFGIELFEKFKDSHNLLNEPKVSGNTYEIQEKSKDSRCLIKSSDDSLSIELPEKNASEANEISMKSEVKSNSRENESELKSGLNLHQGDHKHCEIEVLSNEDIIPTSKTDSETSSGSEFIDGLGEESSLILGNVESMSEVNSLASKNDVQDIALKSENNNHLIDKSSEQEIKVKNAIVQDQMSEVFSVKVDGDLPEKGKKNEVSVEIVSNDKLRKESEEKGEKLRTSIEGAVVSYDSEKIESDGGNNLSNSNTSDQNIHIDKVEGEISEKHTVDNVKNSIAILKEHNETNLEENNSISDSCDSNSTNTLSEAITESEPSSILENNEDSEVEQYKNKKLSSSGIYDFLDENFPNYSEAERTLAEYLMKHIVPGQSIYCHL